MEIHKEFDFIGNLKKLHEDDSNPVEITSTKIYCNRDGSIFIQIDSATKEKLTTKLSSETIDKLTDNHQFVEQQKAAFGKLSSAPINWDNLKKGSIIPGYQGDYTIKGKTSQGWIITADIQLDDFDKAVKEKTDLIKLINLRIDYNPQWNKGLTTQVKSFLPNLDISCNASTFFLDSSYEFKLLSEKNIIAEMTITSLDENNPNQLDYLIYLTWFELLISFATGKYIKQFYRIETQQSGNQQKIVEIWDGNQLCKQDSGFTVIQPWNLNSFLEQCVSKVNEENFTNKRIGLALSWYSDTFSSNVAEVKFLLLSTVLEVLKAKNLPPFDELNQKELSILKTLSERYLSIINALGEKYLSIINALGEKYLLITNDKNFLLEIENMNECHLLLINTLNEEYLSLINALNEKYLSLINALKTHPSSTQEQTGNLNEEKSILDEITKKHNLILKNIEDRSTLDIINKENQLNRKKIKDTSNINKIKREYLSDIRQLKENYLVILKELKKEHLSILEDIKEYLSQIIESDKKQKIKERYLGDIEILLKYYRVSYKDLFPNLEFIQNRNDIVHQGTIERSKPDFNISVNLSKLENLFFRIILSMLEYEGKYQEYKCLENTDKIGRSKHISCEKLLDLSSQNKLGIEPRSMQKRK